MGSYWSAGARGIWVWDTVDSKLRYHIAAQRGVEVCFSTDGKLFATPGPGPIVLVYDLATGHRTCDPIGHPGKVQSARFSSDDSMLVTSCRDGDVRVFDWRSGELVLRGLSHDCDVYNAVFTPNHRFVLSIDKNGMFRAWDARDGRLAMPPQPVGFRNRQILVTPDSHTALVAGASGEIHRIDLAPIHLPPSIDVRRANLLAEILSNRTVHQGGTVKLTTAEWMERWNRYAKEEL